MTTATKGDTITTKTGEGKPPQTRKAFIMKKATLETVVNVLNEIPGFEDGYPGVLDELKAELNKGAAEKAARAAEYEAIHALIVDNLTDTPVTVADLVAEIEGELPEGMNRHKVQYALNNLWQDEIVKIAGKPNTYRRA